MHTDKLRYKELTHLIIKSFYEVYNELGGGFLESVYENAMTLGFTTTRIAHEFWK
jgi:GxxExxY protein